MCQTLHIFSHFILTATLIFGTIIISILQIEARRIQITCPKLGKIRAQI